MRQLIVLSLAIALGSVVYVNAARTPMAVWKTGNRPRAENDIDENTLLKLAHFSRKSLPVAAAKLAKRDDDSDDSNSSSGDAAKIHTTSRSDHEKRLSAVKTTNKRVPADAPLHRRQFNSVLGIGIDAPAAGAGNNAGYGGWNQYVRPPWELSDDEEDEDYSEDESVDKDFKEKLKRNIGWMFPEAWPSEDEAQKVAARGHATASKIIKRLQLLKQEMKQKN